MVNLIHCRICLILIFEFIEVLIKDTSQTTGDPQILKCTSHEKEHLLPFDSKLLTTYTQYALSLKVSKESLVIYQKNKYSVPVRYIGKTVSLQSVTGELIIHYNGECIQRHLLNQKKI